MDNHCCPRRMRVGPGKVRCARITYEENRNPVAEGDSRVEHLLLSL